MRLTRFLKELNWKVYIMELILVILGITIAFQLNILNERRIDSNLEKNFVLNLEKEIQINIDEFKSLESYRQVITRDSRRLVAILRTDEIRKDSVEKYLFKLLRTSTPDLQHQATRSYLESNYGTTNIDLKNELLALQTHFQELMQLSDGYSDRKQETYIKYIRSEVDLLERKILRMNKLRDVEFKNIVWYQATDEFELNRLYNQANKQLTKVDSILQTLIANY